jgi:anti-sigma B factor antagonist
VTEHVDQRTVTPLVIPEIVTLPAEIDIRNADRVARDLCAALRPGASVVIADMSLTQFCDSCGVRSLMIARDRAMRIDAELRLVIASAAVLRVLSVLGIDRLLQIYPSLGVALTTSPGSARNPGD